ncbi:SRPBCC family protein [Brucella gallinifaecis]|uniref:SRPBCC family protein n=1 Tax=Brucella gallinifaecis TaxID=215590 RepID=A0A502BJ41_9HYPH|nr:SRPBCC family protein [Brucella gallinifaecis]TPF74170.1 SRPBCC family protein [Brucella gallinifaecis]
MAKAYASTIINAPVQRVWAEVRDFNALPVWNPAILQSEIEDGKPSDVVGCVRSFKLADGTHVRERLLSLDDSRYSFTYNFEKPAFPVKNYRAGMDLIPVSKTGGTFVQWWAEFDEAPEDSGKYTEIISELVFSQGLIALARKINLEPSSAELEDMWQGMRPAKVFTSSPIDAPLELVWAKMRDFVGMDRWHPDIRDMKMLDGVPADKVSGIRDFIFGEGQLWEQLTQLSDTDHSFRYRILKSPMPWLNYHAGARLYPVTDSRTTFAVWTADWCASAVDDLKLIPNVQNNVFQLAFDTLNGQLKKM